MTDEERRAVALLRAAARGVMRWLWNNDGDVRLVQDLHDALAVAEGAFGPLADRGEGQER